MIVLSFCRISSSILSVLPLIFFIRLRTSFTIPALEIKRIVRKDIESPISISQSPCGSNSTKARPGYVASQTAMGPFSRLCLFSLQSLPLDQITLSTDEKRTTARGKFCWLVACLTSQQHASLSQGRICTDNITCCHTEIEVADQISYLTQSQYTDTGPTSPSADIIMPGAWQGSHWGANFYVTGMTKSGKIPSQAGFEPGVFR